MRVIIAGSRGVTDYELVKRAVSASGFSPSWIISGGARGVDALGERYASEHGIACHVMRANWRNVDGTVNRGAGLARNVDMAKTADAVIAIWDGKSPGTRHMIKTAQKLGLKVYVMNTAQIVPPPPSTPVKRIGALVDSECYPNYWLLRVRPDNAPSDICFELRSGESFDIPTRQRIATIFEAYTVYTFNGNGYDMPMIAAALLGYSCEQLKALSDRIIVEKVKPWELDMSIQAWEPEDHIDLIEVAPGAGSQKQYGARMHSKRLKDLPYDPTQPLTEAQIVEVCEYCGIDLDVLADLRRELRAEIKLREKLSERYGVDLRSKSDAQLAEKVLWLRCEAAAKRKIYKPKDINWNLKFRFDVPDYISYALPQLQQALEIVRNAVFRLGPSGAVEMPPELEGLTIKIGGSVYKMGIGGLHSQEKQLAIVSSADRVLRMPDVASYYPKLILNSGKYPPALGEAFAKEYDAIRLERLENKALAKKLKKACITDTVEYEDAATGDAGGKIMINGTFGKTGSPYSILFAPEMLIQTTLSGQLSLLMLIEWMEHYGIPVVSANTDGIVIDCPRAMAPTSDALINEWEKRTGLEMETEDYRAIYARDVNNYFAIPATGKAKRKGEYGKSGLQEKKNPDCEICSDAVEAFLVDGTPLVYTIAACRDIRKFLTVQKVNGGAVKMWGEGPRKGALVRDMAGVLTAHGWVKDGRQWRRGTVLAPAGVAYEQCFAPQRPEYLGKVVRWYYGTRSPGPIVYATNGNTVSLSYGAQPCMTLPDEFPTDIDYSWYINKAESILKDIGYRVLTSAQ